MCGALQDRGKPTYRKMHENFQGGKMRNPVENISLLQKQINDLQLENQILKNILDRSGISYTHEIARISEHKSAEEYDPDQGGKDYPSGTDHG